MTKNFIEQHETYKDSEGDYWTCVAVSLDTAWCVPLDGDPNRAFAFYLDGTPWFGLSKVCTLLPPDPKIAKTDTNLYPDGNGGWAITFCHDVTDTNGTLYTHEETKVALFVPEEIAEDLFDDAVIALRKEIGQ